MAQFKYTTVVKVLNVLDERKLGQLAKRSTKEGIWSKTWDKAKVEDTIVKASALFESYALNKYTGEQLRTSPVPVFAEEHVTNIVLYKLYGNNKLNRVPKFYKENYEATMKVLMSWGQQLVINEEGEVVAISSGNQVDEIHDDLVFTQDVVDRMW